jgi:hypothetical protein
MKTARFWHWHTGLVKIKIRDGQTVHHSHGGPTDEGYHWEACSYTFDGHTVTCEWSTDSRDCDGRMTRGGITQCDVERLAQGYVDDEAGVTFPAWEDVSHGQRDYAAEAAGY